MKTKHDWQSVNRDVISPEDLTLNDLFEEVRCAVPSDEVQVLAYLLDDGKYTAFGRRIGTLLKWMGDKPFNKTAPGIVKRPRANLAEECRILATASREEAARINATIKAPTGAADRCVARAEVYESIAEKNDRS